MPASCPASASVPRRDGARAASPLNASSTARGSSIMGTRRATAARTASRGAGAEPAYLQPTASGKVLTDTSHANADASSAVHFRRMNSSHLSFHCSGSLSSLNSGSTSTSLQRQNSRLTGPARSANGTSSPRPSMPRQRAKSSAAAATPITGNSSGASSPTVDPTAAREAASMQPLALQRVRKSRGRAVESTSTAAASGVVERGSDSKSTIKPGRSVTKRRTSKSKTDSCRASITSAPTATAAPPAPPAPPAAPRLFLEEEHQTAAGAVLGWQSHSSPCRPATPSQRSRSSARPLDPVAISTSYSAEADTSTTSSVKRVDKTSPSPAGTPLRSSTRTRAPSVPSVVPIVPSPTTRTPIRTTTAHAASTGTSTTATPAAHSSTSAASPAPPSAAVAMWAESRSRDRRRSSVNTSTNSVAVRADELCDSPSKPLTRRASTSVTRQQHFAPPSSCCSSTAASRRSCAPSTDATAMPLLNPHPNIADASMATSSVSRMSSMDVEALEERLAAMSRPAPSRVSQPSHQRAKAIPALAPAAATESDSAEELALESPRRLVEKCPLVGVAVCAKVGPVTALPQTSMAEATSVRPAPSQQQRPLMRFHPSPVTFDNAAGTHRTRTPAIDPHAASQTSTSLAGCHGSPTTQSLSSPPTLIHRRRPSTPVTTLASKERDEEEKPERVDGGSCSGQESLCSHELQSTTPRGGHHKRHSTCSGRLSAAAAAAASAASSSTRMCATTSNCRSASPRPVTVPPLELSPMLSSSGGRVGRGATTVGTPKSASPTTVSAHGESPPPRPVPRARKAYLEKHEDEDFDESLYSGQSEELCEVDGRPSDATIGAKTSRDEDDDDGEDGSLDVDSESAFADLLQEAARFGGMSDTTGHSPVTPKLRMRLQAEQRREREKRRARMNPKLRKLRSSPELRRRKSTTRSRAGSRCSTSCSAPSTARAGVNLLHEEVVVPELSLTPLDRRREAEGLRTPAEHPPFTPTGGSGNDGVSLLAMTRQSSSSPHRSGHNSSRNLNPVDDWITTEEAVASVPARPSQRTTPRVATATFSAAAPAATTSRAISTPAPQLASAEEGTKKATAPSTRPQPMSTPSTPASGGDAFIEPPTVGRRPRALKDLATSCAKPPCSWDPSHRTSNATNPSTPGAAVATAVSDDTDVDANGAAGAAAQPKMASRDTRRPSFAAPTGASLAKRRAPRTGSASTALVADSGGSSDAPRPTETAPFSPPTPCRQPQPQPLSAVPMGRKSSLGGAAVAPIAGVVPTAASPSRSSATRSAPVSASATVAVASNSTPSRRYSSAMATSSTPLVPPRRTATTDTQAKGSAPGTADPSPASPTSGGGASGTALAKAEPKGPGHVKQVLIPLLASPKEKERTATIVFDLDETLCNNHMMGPALLRPGAVHVLRHLRSLFPRPLYKPLPRQTPTEAMTARLYADAFKYSGVRGPQAGKDGASAPVTGCDAGASSGGKECDETDGETTRRTAPEPSLPYDGLRLEIVLWTASVEMYARPVIARLDPIGEIFDQLIFRDIRWYTNIDYTKELARLGRSMDRCVIVENAPASVYMNRRNALLVHDFIRNRQDRQLYVVKAVLEEWLYKVHKLLLQPASLLTAAEKAAAREDRTDREEDGCEVAVATRNSELDEESPTQPPLSVAAAAATAGVGGKTAKEKRSSMTSLHGKVSFSSPRLPPTRSSRYSTSGGSGSAAAFPTQATIPNAATAGKLGESITAFLANHPYVAPGTNYVKLSAVTHLARREAARSNDRRTEGDSNSGDAGDDKSNQHLTLDGEADIAHDVTMAYEGPRSVRLRMNLMQPIATTRDRDTKSGASKARTGMVSTPASTPLARQPVPSTGVPSSRGPSSTASSATTTPIVDALNINGTRGGGKASRIVSGGVTSSGGDGGLVSTPIAATTASTTPSSLPPSKAATPLRGESVTSTESSRPVRRSAGRRSDTID